LTIKGEKGKKRQVIIPSIEAETNLYRDLGKQAKDHLCGGAPRIVFLIPLFGIKRKKPYGVERIVCKKLSRLPSVKTEVS